MNESEQIMQDMMAKFESMMKEIDATDKTDEEKTQGKAALMSLLQSVMNAKGAAEGTDLAFAESEYAEEIEAYFESLFDGELRVFHEMISETVHVDIHIIQPTKQHPFYVMFSTGMSALPMTMPEEMSAERAEKLRYAELVMFLPPEWKMTTEDFKDEKWYWPIRQMKTMVRLPHQCETWLGHGHDVIFSEPPEPFAENTDYCGFILTKMFDDELVGMQAEDGTYINFYCCIPVYSEEIDEKLKKGANEMIMKIMGSPENIVPDKLVVDICRKNVSK